MKPQHFDSDGASEILDFAKEETHHEERFGYVNPMEEKHKANLPIWKGSFSILVFGLCVYYWDLICEVVSKMF